MKKLRGTSALLGWIVLVGLLAGCGGASSAAPYSCNYASAGKCFDYANLSKSSAQSLCLSPGTFAESACSATSRIGSCLTGDITARYYASNWTDSSAQTDCQSRGSSVTYQSGR